MSWINGKTKICGIFGYPVEHSFSPAMHNAAFKYLSLNRAYVPFPVRPENLAYAVEAVRTLGLAGVNVTVPHKQAVTEFLDELSPAARLSGAVNTIVNSGGVLTGHNTDGEGFIRALGESAGSEYIKGPALIIGAGGAARAVAVALALNGTGEIVIANRSAERAAELSSLLGGSTRCSVSALKWEGQPAEGSREHREWAAVLGRVSLLVQTTSLGMHPAVDTVPPIPYNLVHPGQVAVDLVYNPASTGFMQNCREAGAVVFNGIGMLLHQGAIAFELWTGREAPVDIMREALKKELGIRS
ncbi:MAG: shikimate dehydrogenase [Actinobacteria bacterium]|nr:shikimate dehydrogenase [Actinomycetota bacterium]